MSGLRRPSPDRRVLDLTRRLAEDYHTLPLTEVSRVVTAAAAAVTSGDWSGTPQGLAIVVQVIEVLAREDLDELHSSLPAASRQLSADRVVPAPAAAVDGERRQGVG